MSGKRVWGLVAVVVVAAAGFLVWRSARGSDVGTVWRTEDVQRGDVAVLVSATGSLEAVTTVTVGSQISGTVSALYADYNDQVKAGQVLAQLDPTFLKAQVAQSSADLNRTEVQLRQAERDSARIFPLRSEELVSQADLDMAQTAVDAARASVASARANLDRVVTNLHYATVTSPIDGVVVSRDVDVGQTVAASLQAPTLFTIAQDLTQMQLEAAVDEADIGQIKEGQKATFTVDAYPFRTFGGTVHQIRLAPEVVQNVVTYTVVILVENPDKILLPGMTANVSILVDEARDVLKIPAAALRFQPPGMTTSRAGGAGARPRGGGNGRGERGTLAQGGDAGSHEGGARPSHGHVFLPGAAEGTARELRLRIGPSDGSFTAVYTDSLVEGEPLIVGLASGGRGQDQTVVNPFMPNRRGR